jgi:hypothetical protein
MTQRLAQHPDGEVVWGGDGNGDCRYHREGNDQCEEEAESHLPSGQM